MARELGMAGRHQTGKLSVVKWRTAAAWRQRYSASKNEALLALLVNASKIGGDGMAS